MIPTPDDTHERDLHSPVTYLTRKTTQATNPTNKYLCAFSAENDVREYI